MPALNFKAEFAEKVASGEKSQTIRAPRKVPVKAGDRLFLFTGMRTRACRKLREAVCASVQEIEIDQVKGLIWLGGELLERGAADELARRDGFADRCDLADWFEATHGLPFKGQLIAWNTKISHAEDKL